MYSKVIQLYIHIYIYINSFSDSFALWYHRILNIVPMGVFLLKDI